MLTISRTNSPIEYILVKMAKLVLTLCTLTSKIVCDLELRLPAFSYLAGGSSKKWAIIGGGVGGVALVVILLALFAWFRLKKKPKRLPRGEIFWKFFESMIMISYKRRYKIFKLSLARDFFHLMFTRFSNPLFTFPNYVFLIR
jgi:hypothetical protein